MWKILQAAGMDANMLDLEDYAYPSLLDAVVGNKSVRYGPCPSEANKAHIEQRLTTCQFANAPISIFVMYGSQKGYGQFAVRTADLLDLMALKRIACMNKHVRKFHEPGIKVTIVWEDLTERILTGQKDTAYYETFTKLIRTVRLDDVVTVVKETTLVDDHDRFAAIAEEYAEEIKNGKEWRIGWNGVVPWDHYLTRSVSEFPDKSEEERRHEVSRYFGLSLARSRFAMMPKTDLKLSFVPYHASAPDALRKGRIEIKVKPNKNGDKTAAPWTSFGVVGDNCWSHASAREVRSTEFVIQRITVNGIMLPALKRVS